MILIFTGNGKGKTTAALGQALRSVGEGKRVLMIQFIKGPWRSGEDFLTERVLKNVIARSPAPFCSHNGAGRRSNPESSDCHDTGLLRCARNDALGRLQIIKTGLGFVGILGDTRPIEEHREAAEKGLILARTEALSGNWDMLILDEVNNAVALNLLAKGEILDFIDEIAAKLEHFILTGRDAPQEFIDRADLVTEMQDIKHPFEQGIKAKRGLEY